jgi:hypothetical protein
MPRKIAPSTTTLATGSNLARNPMKFGMLVAMPG